MAMNEAVRQALTAGGTIDITTIGRASGQPRRIEIVFHNVEGTIYITGTPGRPRSWYANLRARPSFTFHLKQGVVADLAARATPITDPAQRRAVLTPIARDVAERWGQQFEADAWVQSSPLVAVSFEGA